MTRSDVFRAWQEVLSAAQPWDTVLFTYSGHGSRIPALQGNPSNESDGYDETLILTGFDAAHGRAAEHLIDDEINRLLLDAHKKGVFVVLVADASHAGTIADQVPPNVLLLAAAQEDEIVPEFPELASGLYRGGLSVVVAQALGGGAFTDGVITVKSLTTFVHRRLRLIAEDHKGTRIWPTTVTTRGDNLNPDTPLFVVPGGSEGR